MLEVCQEAAVAKAAVLPGLPRRVHARVPKGSTGGAFKAEGFGMMGEPAMQRFCRKFLPDERTRCWEWLAGRGPGGYGQFWNGKRRVVAPRFSYEAFRGPIAVGLQIDHLCRNPGCVNPSHMELVTPAENTARGNAGLHMRAKSAALTHCPAGHPYSRENTSISKRRGTRICKTCRRLKRRGDA